MLFRLICNLGFGSQTLLVLQCLPTEISDKDQTSQHLFLFKKKNKPNPYNKNQTHNYCCSLLFPSISFPESHRQDANNVLLWQRVTEVAVRPPSLFFFHFLTGRNCCKHVEDCDMCLWDFANYGGIFFSTLENQ